MKILKDDRRCVSSGHCCFIAPEIFEMRNGTLFVLKPEGEEGLRDAIAEAVGNCPAEALSMQD